MSYFGRVFLYLSVAIDSFLLPISWGNRNELIDLVSPPSPQKTGILGGLGRAPCWGHVQVVKPAERVNKQGSPPRYPVVRTSYIDMSSRFTAPHCLSYYEAINSRAAMNWLTLRVAAVASCNLIPCIILSVRPGLSLFSSCMLNAG